MTDRKPYFDLQNHSNNTHKETDWMQESAVPTNATTQEIHMVELSETNYKISTFKDIIELIKALRKGSLVPVKV